MPDDHRNISFEDIDLYQKIDTTRVMFRENVKFEDILHLNKCRLLTEEDSFKFMEFHKACPNSDKEQGMVSLVDPTVYGCYEDGKLVSVASLWNWGDNLSDIGVLTHPEYRNFGYGLSVCQSIINEVDRQIIWRCDMKNKLSYKLAKKLGFIQAGNIYNLVKKN